MATLPTLSIAGKLDYVLKSLRDPSMEWKKIYIYLFTSNQYFLSEYHKHYNDSLRLARVCLISLT